MSYREATIGANEHLEGRAICNSESSWTDDMLCRLLPTLAIDAHKFSRGVLTVVAGSKAYPGAALMTAHASQRMGTGFTELVSVGDACRMAVQAYPSLVVYDLDSFDPSVFFGSKGRKRQAVCIGPGFVPGHQKSDALVIDVLKSASCPVLVDGGALACLSSKKALKVLAKREKRGYPTVITPHTGEAGRLCAGLGIADESPMLVAQKLSSAMGVIAVVKGPDTFISDGDRVYAMKEGTPVLAKAGSGDVLAGMAASLMAQGIAPFDAAVLATTLHARAGVLAACELADISITPEDVIETIPAAVRALQAVQAS